MCPSDASSASALVVAGDEETRVLLRGLLRLHHFQVLGEADGSSRALALLRENPPSVLVADVNLAEGSISNLLSDARKLQPDLHIILVGPALRPPTLEDGPVKPDAVLLRPFRIQQFSEALAPATSPDPATVGS